MTTIPTVSGFITTVDPDRITERSKNAEVDGRRAMLALAALVPLVLGWMCGALVRGALFMAAAFAEGYDRGRTRPAPAGAPSTPRAATIARSEG